MAADRLLILAEAPPRRRSDASHYETCLREVVGVAARERGRVEIWFARGRSTSRFLRLHFPHHMLQEQVNGKLGPRVADAFGRSFADGAERVVALLRPGPALPEATLTSAFHDLQEADMVLGPTVGGGCYLLGLRAESWDRARPVFEDVDWAGDAEWDTLLRSATDAGLSPRVLPGIAG